MSAANLPLNLRTLCAYSHSISDVCRRAGINRQQFTKYLNGGGQPSLRSLRRICDFFGVEEHEILMEPGRFRELVRLRPPRLAAEAAAPIFDPGAVLMAQLASCHDADIARSLVGYYFLYQRDDRWNAMINRSLVRLAATAKGLAIKALDIFSGGTSTMPSCVKYAGTGFVLDGRAHLMVRECLIGKAIWYGSFYLTDFDRNPYLSGLSMGVEPDPRAEVIALRTVLQFIGTEIDVRAAVRRCGQIPESSPEFNDIVRHSTLNDQRDGDAVFASRL
ncbi:helix-turn-helix domain-containing protein [Dongia sp.]|uniref:helix-turn-helix domain-containing protein n=1 Tax=Dongia sp. TaxID=1977262 RepID=UPI0035B2158C